MDEAARLAAQYVQFSDRNHRKYLLSPKALHHIKHDNCIDQPTLFIEQTFRNTVIIVESGSKRGTWLYYSPLGNGLYRTVVASTEDQRVKTAYISDRIKKGAVIWQATRLTI